MVLIDIMSLHLVFLILSTYSKVDLLFKICFLIAPYKVCLGCIDIQSFAFLVLRKLKIFFAYLSLEKNNIVRNYFPEKVPEFNKLQCICTRQDTINAFFLKKFLA